MMSSWAQTGFLMFFTFAGPTLWTAKGTGSGTAFTAGSGFKVHGVTSMQWGLWDRTAGHEQQHLTAIDPGVLRSVLGKSQF